ncbi:DUF3397 domain-containing protein [Brevibacillus sp. M2.1A]|uniref:DUF3397 domain-containing protein n=1 Tax=Bacillales TaxID=1385 RepID=UPI00034B4A18|nr:MULTISPECIES: DUF3397 domain-containing protein [Bacillales]KMZ40157.1 hypothetical protein AC624_03260 [Bacillus sp. FJAT-27238]MBY0088588.1 DUF3397 domain-containing protein [Brevibacillus brevis]MCC8437184.1 DUF3397 domain-containing protein [Brevibacillus sp. M2.1A]MCE0449774.1 DUF3397 domain-containing protein [Brevibacillus sp. AF8]UKK99335.1 DUF3397 domain-containing protein [Brevibacillus brevis]
MTFLANVWAYLWGTLTVVPFLGFPIVYFILYGMTRNKKLAGRFAINITNLLVIRSAVSAYELIWPEAFSAWWWVFCFYLVVTILLGWVQMKLKGRLSLKKVGFSAWRLSFLWFGIVYIVLFTTGIIKTMGVV